MTVMAGRQRAIAAPGPNNDLIRYAAAMGNTRGLLPDDLSLFNAFAIRDGGTARV
jgi:hypothetical protein